MGFKMSLILVVPPRGRLLKLTAEIYRITGFRRCMDCNRLYANLEDRFIFKVLKRCIRYHLSVATRFGRRKLCKYLWNDFQSLQRQSFPCSTTTRVATILIISAQASRWDSLCTASFLDYRYRPSGCRMKKDINLPVLEHNKLVDLPHLYKRDIQPFIKIPATKLTIFNITK